jgi:hypothetical protein
VLRYNRKGAQRPQRTDFTSETRKEDRYTAKGRKRQKGTPNKNNQARMLALKELQGRTP